MKKFFTFTLIILFIVVLSALVFDWGRREVKAPESEAPSSIERFVSNSTSTSDMPIVVNSVKDNQEISSPLKIEGKARGSWFFEASFPIELIDINGNVLARTVAEAQGDWMTTEFVNFTATLQYTKSTSTNHALLVLSKDNPSGNPDLDQSIFIPVTLK